MRQFNYKCLISNGSKRYYKKVGGKWKRINNKLGEKVEKGKKTYKANTPKFTNEFLCYHENEDDCVSNSVDCYWVDKCYSKKDIDFTIDDCFEVNIPKQVGLIEGREGQGGRSRGCRSQESSRRGGSSDGGSGGGDR
mgnify:CR=1 FL=1